MDNNITKHLTKVKELESGDPNNVILAVGPLDQMAWVIPGSDWYISVYFLKSGVYCVNVWDANENDSMSDHYDNWELNFHTLDDIIEQEDWLRNKIKFTTSDKFWNNIFNKWLRPLYMYKQWNKMWEMGNTYE